MYNFFKDIHNFFISLTIPLGRTEIFVIFGGFFLATILCVLILTARAYESRLIKAIDMFNNYFIDNAQINEDNLVAFNNKMKSKKVPKQLRKQWQQFVLYRENNASHYMSFENCVSNPIRNSSFKIDIKVMNIIAYITASLSFLLTMYCEDISFLYTLQQAIITPVIILLLNYLVTIFLDLRHNAIVSDLYQNYQYFEVNIDKATKTLPDYVDYEVLFDKNEIKRGIPILYAYLQKRAEEEQRELERARLKNIEHEKFSFDEAGVAGSLVLERAMQEAENYIAERKKYNQDTEQINTDITQEDMNYREITKEYNRQMQVSKESFANYKAQLEEASSSIEANYLKKQQQQELDRQRNLEREFDTATERHKKVIQSYQSELDTVDKFRAESRKNLESAMMSEFSSYSSKVYDEAKKQAELKQKEKFDKLKANIKELEERIVSKDHELEHIYAKHQELTEALENSGELSAVQDMMNQQSYVAPTPTYEEPQDNGEQPLEYVPEYEDVNYEEPANQESETFNYDTNEEESFDFEPISEQFAETNNTETEETFNYEPIEEEEKFDYEPENLESEDNIESEEEIKFNYEPIEEELTDLDTEPEQEADEDFEPIKDDEEGYINPYLEPIKQEETKVDDSTDQENESIESGETIDVIIAPKKKAGRPRKIVDPETIKPKRSVGRPKKLVDNEPKQKKKAGRPRKVEIVDAEPKKKVGRPKKETVEIVDTPKKAGRPKKVVVSEQPMKKKAGRPKKVVDTTETTEKRPVGRPKKVVKRGVGRPRKEKIETTKRPVGRPKKSDSIAKNDHVDIDLYLQEIDKAIANENAVIEKARKELEKKAKIKTKK
ncbi:MAG: hypothetical protein ACLRFL_02000 [Clostridia bacterium]